MPDIAALCGLVRPNRGIRWPDVRISYNIPAEMYTDLITIFLFLAIRAVVTRSSGNFYSDNRCATDFAGLAFALIDVGNF